MKRTNLKIKKEQLLCLNKDMKVNMVVEPVLSVHAAVASKRMVCSCSLSHRQRYLYTDSAFL
jgi:hypothetical protein